MGYKRWVYTNVNKELASALAEECGLDPLLCYLLTGRGVETADEAMEFLMGNELSCDPFAYVDMDAAVERIQRALDEGESIAVYGDYDADGITSTVLLYTYLKSKGARVRYRLPSRSEGYGLHTEVIDELADQGVQLIVTVDNGIAAVEEIAYANRRDIDVVVTDHHQPPAVLPNAVAVVDPHRKDCPSTFKDLAGVGVAFHLACALEGDIDSVFQAYGDLVAVGTLADVMPLYGDNRVLVRRGLQRLNRPDGRLGFRRLREYSGGEQYVGATGVSFTIAPRINAAGRMDCPDSAAELLLCDDEELAGTLTSQIHGYNDERQRTESLIMKELLLAIDHDDDILSRRVLVVWGEGWHHGVLGIVAARLTERFGKPCLVLSVDNGIARGSGRSIAGFSLYEALCACDGCLLGYGGHAQAAGVTLEAARLREFSDCINRYAAQVAPRMPEAELKLDCRLRAGQISVDMVESLSALEPVGTGNPRPLFGLVRMTLEHVEPVGGGKHLRLSFLRDGTRITAMKFSTLPTAFPYHVGDVLDLAVVLDRNEYRGTASVSIVIRDMRYSDLPQEELLDALAEYETVLRREGAVASLPSREHIARVYRFVKQQPFYGAIDVLCYRLRTEECTCTAVLLACRILREAGLIEWRDEGDAVYISVRETEGKTDLTQTATARYLEGRD